MQVVERQVGALGVCQGVGHDLGGVVVPGAAVTADDLRAGRQHLDPFGDVGAQLEAEGGGEGAIVRGGLSFHAAMVGGMRGRELEEGVQ
ncbi:hypothetical protein D9M69_523970 [compost metagenome]